MNVLVVVEDPALDEHIARPVIEALMADAGIRGKVRVLSNPRLRGANDALDRDILGGIVARTPGNERVVLIVDRDCNRAQHDERARQRESEHLGKVLACVAVQEVEVWMLALHQDGFDARWSDVRAECDPKERWAEPLLSRIHPSGPGKGRKWAMRRLSGKVKSLLSLCPELADLQKRLREVGEG